MHRGGSPLAVATAALALRGLLPVGARAEIATALSLDLYARANPVGAALALGLAERVRRADRPSALEQGRYLELGGFLELRPDGALLSLGLDWVPLAVLEFFDAPTARFGDDVLSAREGEEQTGFGQRLYASPVLRARLGPFVLRNEATASLYRRSSSPGYYYESEHDTPRRTACSRSGRRSCSEPRGTPSPSRARTSSTATGVESPSASS